MKHFLKLFLLITLISCSSEEDTVEPTPAPETFGSWTPSFSNQTSDFTQTRNGNQGTEETRTINITSNSSTVSKNETQENQDFNGDGDKVDDVDVTNTTYNASQGLGSRTDISGIITLDRDANVFNTNLGIWFAGIYVDDGTDEGEFAGYQGYRFTLDGISETLTSADGSCYDIVDTSDSEDAVSDSETVIAINDKDLILSSTLGVDNFFTPAQNDYFETTGVAQFNVYIGFEKTNIDGVEYIAYFLSYYDADFEYSVPTLEDFLNDSDIAANFILDSDIYIAGFLSNIAESDLPPQCTGSKTNIENSIQHKLLRTSLERFQVKK
jgi:hypothetical protein